MDARTRKVFDAFCKSVNQIKKMGLSADSTSPELFLGGDLGIDSIEMLEIWYEMEQNLGVMIDDSEKRNIYSIQEVINVVVPKVAD